LTDASGLKELALHEHRGVARCEPLDSDDRSAADGAQDVVVNQEFQTWTGVTRPNSMAAVLATSLPWCRAPARSVSVGWRIRRSPQRVVAPYGEPPTIWSTLI